MNDRIKELVNQAYDTVEFEYSQPVVFFNKEKFAKLIVCECASMARSYVSHQYDFTGDLELDEFMLKHFGVE